MVEALTSAPPEAIDDHTLMLRVREGDIPMLGELFQRHARPLYGFFVRLTGDRAGSDDMVQQVFHRILRYRHTYRDVGSFTGWMYIIARRVLADFQRHRAQHQPPAEEPALEQLADERTHAADAAEAGDQTALLHRALATLPEDVREVIVLARFQELPYEEVARILDISLSAVKTRIHRAMKDLRAAYFRIQEIPPMGLPTATREKESA
ncbi:MAG: sigma-70 family RNA polymerase sigma factor [Opitutaceae bacterium]|nr:sigma-70 family RNA polymerase sigma factor [Opitutaceae bacterium]